VVACMEVFADALEVAVHTPPHALLRAFFHSRVGLI
jgi:hypothetical protein